MSRQKVTVIIEDLDTKEVQVMEYHNTGDVSVATEYEYDYGHDHRRQLDFGYYYDSQYRRAQAMTALRVRLDFRAILGGRISDPGEIMRISKSQWGDLFNE